MLIHGVPDKRYGFSLSRSLCVCLCL
jgi:hypothetical protein